MAWSPSNSHIAVAGPGPVGGVLALHDIDKTFDGFKALQRASFIAEKGQVHALLGENGAGKSTLMNVACGLYGADAGRMLVDGEEVRLSGPRQAADLGIGMVHQHFRLVRPFSVVDNVVLTGQGEVAGKNYRRAVEIAAKAIVHHAAALGRTIDPFQRIDSLPVAEQQLVEVIRALVAGARILIFDEPTALLTDQEADRLLNTLRNLADMGSAVILITHKLTDVKRFADRVTVMRGGRTIASVDPASLSVAELTRMTVGDTAEVDDAGQRHYGRRRLEVIDLACTRADGTHAFSGVNFNVRSGEIYGIAGVSGNGQAELAETLMGLRSPNGGVIQLEDAGESLQNATPDRLRASGAAFVPADRYRYGLASGLPIADNFAIGGVINGHYGSWAWIRRRTMESDAATAVKDFDVQGIRSLNQKAALLSGGNAQKLVIAREFRTSPTIVVAQSPSRGLDVRATLAVHGRLGEARDRGAAVLLLSEDLDEILKLSDRVGVMSAGRLVAEFERPVDRQEIGRAMVAHA